MIVTDANVIAYLWITGHEEFKSHELLLKDPDWWVPQLYKSEIQSVLLLHIRKNIITTQNAIHLMEKIEKQFEFTTMHVPSQLVLTLGERTSCSAYDCEYAALALTLGCPLITTDKKILQSFPTLAMAAANYLALK